MSRGPGTRVAGEIDHGQRTVGGITVQITELVWNGGAGSSFEVYLAGGDQACLTMDGAFDSMPGDDEIRELISAPRDEYGYIVMTDGGLWSCAGCGASYSESDAGLIVGHVRDCDKVNGAGSPL